MSVCLFLQLHTVCVDPGAGLMLLIYVLPAFQNIDTEEFVKHFNSLAATLFFFHALPCFVCVCGKRQIFINGNRIRKKRGRVK